MIPKYNKTQKKALLKALHTLAKDGPVRRSYGICGNLDEIVVQGRKRIDTYHFVSFNAVNWPGRTGVVKDYGSGAQSVYPIYRGPGREPLWEGAQLEQRMSLIAYLTEQLEAA